MEREKVDDDDDDGDGDGDGDGDDDDDDDDDNDDDDDGDGDGDGEDLWWYMMIYDDIWCYMIIYDDIEKEEDDVEEEDRSQGRDPHLARACAVEMPVEISQEPLYTEMYRKNAAAHVEPRTQTHTLCEPAQSERMSWFHKSHFMRKFTGKMPRPSWIPQAGPALCASLRNSNTHQHFTRDIRRATLYGILQEKWRSPEWAQNADTHFVRACAVGTHVKISQEPLSTEIYR